MSVKQDRTGARTAVDLERKYNFGKTFAEMLGLINDSRDKVDAVASGLQDEIRQTATEIKRDTESIVAKATEKVEEIERSVELKVDASDLSIEFENRLNNVESVTTRTGYRFDSEGLIISKSGTAITNKIDNTGMAVIRSGEEILVANKDGVSATNLHANTYLIIGNALGASRFESFNTNRTGCFWIN